MRCVLVVIAVLVGCVDQGPGPQPKVSASYVRAHLLEREPADLTRIDAAFSPREGDAPAVVYLGNTLTQPRVAPGGTITLTHYWKVLAPLGERWRPFAIVRGPAGSADFMNLDATDMQRGHPPSAWKPGQIIEDVQTITLRPDWRAPSATVLVGLIEVGRHGTLDRMPVRGPREGAGTPGGVLDRALVAAVLEVDLSRAPPPAGTIHVPRAQGPITIDGVANEGAWGSAVVSPELVTAEGFREEPNGRATAKMVWDDQHLYLFVSVADSDISTTFQNHDDPMWKADCVEIFIDADGNRRGYIELQVNPYNATFDSWFAGPRGPAGDVSWDSGMVTQVKVHGTPAPGDTDRGWDVEIGIPWAAVKGRDPQMAVTVPPRIGDRWRLNVVRVDKRSGKDGVIAASWNRITYSDFHALDRMLVAVFADVDGVITPRAERPAQPGSAAAAAGRGSAAPAAGSAAPAAGSAAPMQLRGTAAPAAGSATPMQLRGTAAPAAGSATPMQLRGTAAPAAGSAAPMQLRGTAAPRPQPVPGATGPKPPETAGSAVTAPRTGAGADR